MANYNETVVVLDFGGQYKELIAQSVRRLGVYSVIKQGDISVDELKQLAPIGIILTGGPNSVRGEGALTVDPQLFGLGVPVLGICYGMQLMCHMLGGEVTRGEQGEYGRIKSELDGRCVLFDGVDMRSTVLMSHHDRVKALPEGFECFGSTKSCSIAACGRKADKLYALQFHPEVKNTDNGLAIMKNFLFGVCGAKGDYNIDDYIERAVAEIRERVGDKRVLLALSGGVDSSVLRGAAVARDTGSADLHLRRPRLHAQKRGQRGRSRVLRP